MKEIEEFLKNENEKCVLLNGAWGSGKTHYLKNEFKEHIKEKYQKKEYVYINITELGNKSIKEICYFNSNVNKKASEQISSIIEGLDIADKKIGNAAKLINRFYEEGIKKKIKEFDYDNYVIIIDEIERKPSNFDFEKFLNDVFVLKENYKAKIILSLNLKELKIKKNNDFQKELNIIKENIEKIKNKINDKVSDLELVDNLQENDKNILEEWDDKIFDLKIKYQNKEEINKRREKINKKLKEKIHEKAQLYFENKSFFRKNILTIKNFELTNSENMLNIRKMIILENKIDSIIKELNNRKSKAKNMEFNLLQLNENLTKFASQYLNDSLDFNKEDLFVTTNYLLKEEEAENINNHLDTEEVFYDGYYRCFENWSENPSPDNYYINYLKKSSKIKKFEDIKEELLFIKKIFQKKDADILQYIDYCSQEKIKMIKDSFENEYFTDIKLNIEYYFINREEVISIINYYKKETFPFKNKEEIIEENENFLKEKWSFQYFLKLFCPEKISEIKDKEKIKYIEKFNVEENKEEIIEFVKKQEDPINIIRGLNEENKKILVEEYYKNNPYNINKKEHKERLFKNLR